MRKIPLGTELQLLFVKRKVVPRLELTQMHGSASLLDWLVRNLKKHYGILGISGSREM